MFLKRSLCVIVRGGLILNGIDLYIDDTLCILSATKHLIFTYSTIGMSQIKLRFDLWKNYARKKLNLWVH